MAATGGEGDGREIRLPALEALLFVVYFPGRE
jgi:hypothetical protein